MNIDINELKKFDRRKEFINKAKELIIEKRKEIIELEKEITELEKVKEWNNDEIIKKSFNIPQNCKIIYVPQYFVCVYQDNEGVLRISIKGSGAPRHIEYQKFFNIKN